MGTIAGKISRTSQPSSGGIWPNAVGALIVIAGLAPLIIPSLQPGVLAQPVSPDLLAAGVFAGMVAALLLAWQLGLRAVAAGRPVGKTLAAVVFILAMVGVRLPLVLVRAGVQAAGFVGVAPVPRPLTLRVTGTRYDWWAKRGWYVTAALPDTGYVLALPASSAAFDQAQPGDRITLAMETGRFGLRRLLAPSRLLTTDLHHQ